MGGSDYAGGGWVFGESVIERCEGKEVGLAFSYHLDYVMPVDLKTLLCKFLHMYRMPCDSCIYIDTSAPLP